MFFLRPLSSPTRCSLSGLFFAIVFGLSIGSHGCAWSKNKTPSTTSAPKATLVTYSAEARLIEIYKLIGQGKHKEAFVLAERLVQDFPNFQLGQLVYGDLLSLKTRPVKALGDLPASMSQKPANQAALTELREEAQLRIQALAQRPPHGTIPIEFLKLTPRNKHAIAVDVSKSRLYLFENQAEGLKLIADYYISIGKSGFGKSAEGDLRTPLGVYFITSRKDPKELAPLYGGGALPINYPNPLDIRLGKTGSGIWLHGTPPERYARPPKSTDGCVVLANPDLFALLEKVAIKTTPVVIAAQLHWTLPAAIEADRRAFLSTLETWRKAKTSGQLELLKSHYQDDFSQYGKSLQDWWPQVVQQVKHAQGREWLMLDTSVLQWRSAEASQRNTPTMVVTFDENLSGESKTRKSKLNNIKRQYWMQRNGQWKIFFEGSVPN